MRKGDVVRDERVGEVAEIVAVKRVPACADLFGEPVPGHMRYVLRYRDGRWADDRRASDLRRAAVAA